LNFHLQFENNVVYKIVTSFVSHTHFSKLVLNTRIPFSGRSPPQTSAFRLRILPASIFSPRQHESGKLTRLLLVKVDTGFHWQADSTTVCGRFHKFCFREICADFTLEDIS